MNWKDRWHTMSATVFACASLFAWYALIDSDVDSKPLAWGLLISSISGGVLAVSHLFGGRSRGMSTDEIPTSTTSEARLYQIEATEERLADLEARLEFAERLLVDQQRVGPLSSQPANRQVGREPPPAFRTPSRVTPRP
jgi:hypothetical protein